MSRSATADRSVATADPNAGTMATGRSSAPSEGDRPAAFPDAGLLRRVLAQADWAGDLSAVSARTIKVSSTPAAVYRLRLEYAGAGRGPATLIAKRVAPGWSGDANGELREMRFYSRLAGSLGIPQPRVYYAGPEPDSDRQLILMEDVARQGPTQRYRFPPAHHAWTAAELRTGLRTYAALHVHGRDRLPSPEERDWLFPPYERRVLDRAADLPRLADELAGAGLWPSLPGLPALVERVVEGAGRGDGPPPTLLHNDVAPPNVGLPRDGAAGDLALLLDWEMAGWGPAELDLAYMFMQPFDNTAGLPRDELLDVYWAERRRLEGAAPPADERRQRQAQADALLALWLIPVAHERLLAPFPEGTTARVYWDSMGGVLARRLISLAG